MIGLLFFYLTKFFTLLLLLLGIGDKLEKVIDLNRQILTLTRLTINR